MYVGTQNKVGIYGPGIMWLLHNILISVQKIV